MKNEFTFLSKDGKTQIHAIEWLPEGEITAVLQIAHGMVEFIDRYDPFARYLAENGIAVVGNDHLGHGLSVTDEEQYGFFAEENGNACVIGDLHELRRLTEEKHPWLPYFFMGHSMGSFLARQYIEMHGAGLAGAIIMGTGQQPGLVLALGKMLCRSSAKKNGWHFRDKKINGMAIGANNKRFEPARTPADWLTRNEAVVDAYLANPLNTFIFTVNAYYNMFSGIQYAQKNVRSTPQELPILLVSGAEDPVGAFGKGVKKVYDAYRAAGIRDLQMKLYEGDRHEILNELDCETVFADLLAWIRERADSGKKRG